MSLLPLWARKPKHKLAVVATDKGWVVEKTGEVLVSIRDLDSKLKQFLSEVNELDGSLGANVVSSKAPDNDPVSTHKEEENSTETEDTKDLIDDIKKVEEEEDKTEKEVKPKRGRKPKNNSK